MSTPIFPPRPRGKIAPTDLAHYEGSGQWVAQRKFNDTRNLLHIEPGLRMTAWSRHGSAHKRFVLTQRLQDEIRANLRLDPELEYWLDGGVMMKHKGARGEMVFWDVLQAGKYLFAKPDQMERLRILADICGNPTRREPGGIALQVSGNIWMAETFVDDFEARFTEALDDDRIEGLLLRKKNSALDNFGRVYYEVGWQLRCRKPSKAYNF